jgi:hypothetical protein
MRNSLLEISKVSFWEEVSFETYNIFNANSNKNELLLIYSIYIKRFTSFSDI